MSRKEEENGLSSTDDCEDVTIQRLEDKIKKSQERLLTAASTSHDNIRPKRKTTKARKITV